MFANPSIRHTISEVTFGIITIFALLIQINCTDNINRHCNVLESENDTTVSRNIPEFDHSHMKQLSPDKIKLHIIQTVIEKIAEVLPSSKNESNHRVKRSNLLPKSAPISSPSRPNDSFKKLEIFDKGLEKMKEELASLNLSVSLSDEDKSRISILLETTIKDIQATLMGFQKENVTVLSIINKLETSICIGMVESIKSGHFSFAEKQLQVIDDSILRKVVQEVYSHQIDNIDLLLRFGDSLTDLEKKFTLGETLYYEIRNNGHVDIQILFRLIQSYRRGIYDLATGTLMDRSRSFIRNLWNENQNITLTLISTTFISNTSRPIVKKVIDEIHRSCGLKCLVDIYNATVENVFDTLDISELLAKFDQIISTTEERIMIYELLINKMERNGRLCDDSVIPVLCHMKITWDDSGFKNYDWRHLFKIIINKLPSSLRYIVLSSSTNTSNSHFNKSPYATDSCTLLEETLNSFRKQRSAEFFNTTSWETFKRAQNEIRILFGVKVLVDVYKEVIEKAMYTLSIENILATAERNLNSTEGRIMIYEIIINTMERSGSLYNDSVLSLVRQMKITWNDPEFNSEDWRFHYKIIINKLPRSLRNIVLSPSSILCIKNTHYNEYLYAANYSYPVGGYYNQVFTGIPKCKDELPDFKWIINFNRGLRITIRNVRYDGFLTFAGNDYSAAIGLDLESWTIAVDGEGVNLSYLENHGYLFGNNESLKDNMHYVGILNSHGKPPYPSKWELVDCSDITQIP